MKNHQLLRCIFPDVLADYFDVVDIQESVSQIDFWLDERNFMEKSDHKLGTEAVMVLPASVLFRTSPFVAKQFTSMFAAASGVTVPTERYLLIHMMI